VKNHAHLGSRAIFMHSITVFLGSGLFASWHPFFVYFC